MALSLADRLWRRVQKGDGCWIWTGSLNRKGYGSLFLSRHPKRTVLAHRAAWQVTNGHIPDSLFVCHRCDNPPCVNPAHLFLGTQLDNLVDMFAKGRWRMPPPIPKHLRARGEQQGQAKLTSAQVLEIRLRKQAGETYPALATAFGVCLNSVVNVVHRKTWRHIP